jgi:methylmalonyl-CoA mutase
MAQGMTSIPDFTKIKLEGSRKANGVAHEAPAAAESELFTTPEGIPVKPVYTDADTAGLDFLDTWPGIAPYVRGPYLIMYVT